MNIRRYAVVSVMMLVIDWTLGALITYGKLPLWSFLLVNFPFGLPHVWLESHWRGTSYVVAGRNVDELWSFAVFLFAVFAQAALYSWLLGRCRRQRSTTIRSASP